MQIARRLLLVVTLTLQRVQRTNTSSAGSTRSIRLYDAVSVHSTNVLGSTITRACRESSKIHPRVSPTVGPSF